MTDEKLKQLRVEALRVRRNFFDLQSWFDVEVVAHVARLKIAIEQADAFVARALLGFQLYGGLDRDRRGSHPPGARHKSRYHGPAALSRCSGDLGFPARDDVENILRRTAAGNPIGAAAQQTFVIRCRNLVADEYEEQVLGVLTRDLDQPVNGRGQNRKNDAYSVFERWRAPQVFRQLLEIIDFF